MAEIGVRELKVHASEIVRAVRDEHALYVITYRGRPVGILAPVEASPGGKLESAAWEELTEIGEEIGRGWRSPLTSAEILSQMRR